MLELGILGPQHYSPTHSIEIQPHTTLLPLISVSANFHEIIFLAKWAIGHFEDPSSSIHTIFGALQSPLAHSSLVVQELCFPTVGT